MAGMSTANAADLMKAHQNSLFFNYISLKKWNDSYHFILSFLSTVLTIHTLHSPFLTAI